jgi:hypothetical protein
VGVLEKDTREMEILGAQCEKREEKKEGKNDGAMDKIKQKSDRKTASVQTQEPSE